MIGAHARTGGDDEAFRLFLQIQREGIIPDAITYSSNLNQCASSGALKWAREVHACAVQAGLEKDVRVGSALVNMYWKSGNIENTQEVSDSLKKRDIIIWNVMIGAYKESGHG
jgi:pentatricopeptide repeat protein